ncbi:galactokinase [Pelosinus sp. sgz500959]|uniref:galactokinase n=1 Tax=Pelosinus sp. sgz500959 TaxID=3242472 RepID=UPI0036718403
MMEIDQLKNAFEEEFGVSDQPMQCFFAPGRVNLIGEHIDYNGGVVFPAALSLGVYGILRFRSDQVVHLKSMNTPLKVSVDLKTPILYEGKDGWGNYPKGVIKFLLDYGHSIRGCEILFSGNLPDGAGLSSSAAILVLTAYMLRYANGDHTIDCVKLARFCQKVENEFTKVNCGIMDQFAVAMGREECAILLDCQNLSYKYIPFVLGEYRLVIMNTNKKRELADSKYNQRRGECEEALELIRKHRSVDNLCQALLTDVEAYIEDSVLQRRAQHVISENHRVLLATELLAQGDLIGFGHLMTQSHLSLKNDYEVTGLELDTIVDCALESAGCIGARMTGAGFGGCAIALVKMEKIEEFKRTVYQGYNEITGLTPDFYVASIADGVKLIT